MSYGVRVRARAYRIDKAARGGTSRAKEYVALGRGEMYKTGIVFSPLLWNLYDWKSDFLYRDEKGLWLSDFQFLTRIKSSILWEND